MSEDVLQNSRWRNKRTGRVAVVFVARNARDFPSQRSAYGDGSDDAYADLAAENRLADSKVGYRYKEATGRSLQTVWVKRKAFLKAFEPVRAPRGK